MFAVNKDYNSYFKVIKPEVELSFEGVEDASKVAAILMKQGYVVTMYKDDPGMDVYCLYATYVGENGYDYERMAAFIDTRTEKTEDAFPTEDVFPDDAEPLAEDEDDAEDSDNNPEKWDDENENDDGDEDDRDIDYYGLGYSDGEFARQYIGEYDDTVHDEDDALYNEDYARGYTDGWNDADVEDESEAAEDEAEVGRRITDPFNRWAGRMPK